MIRVLKKLKLSIGSILGGQSPTYYLSEADQFLLSVGIDPEKTYGTRAKANGGIIPTAMTSITSGTGLGSSAPMWVSSAQTSTGVMVYAASGTVYTYSNTFTAPDEEGGIVKPTSGAGNGMVVYGDYAYFATTTDIARFGPLSATAPRLTQNFWTGSDYLNKSALTNTTYPSTRNINYPNHTMHLHNDGAVYICDYANNQGMLHSFYIAQDGTETTAVYQDLTLPPGQLPTDIESYGTDVAVTTSPAIDFSVGAVPRPSLSSSLILWDAVSGHNFYRNVPVNEAMCTAVVNKNGELHVWGGNLDQAVTLLKYLGGYSFQELAHLGEGSPPLASAVDSLGNMVAWGGWATYPEAFAGAYTYGYRNAKMPRNALNQILRISDSTNTLPVISCLKFLLRSAYPVIGWRTDTTASYGIDRQTTGVTYASIFYTKVFNVGRPFSIRRIRIPLTAAVDAGTSIIPIVYFDNEGASETLATINNTNYPNSDKIIDYTDLAIGGTKDFFIRFTFQGTTEVGFPPEIDIELEIID